MSNVIYMPPRERDYELVLEDLREHKKVLSATRDENEALRGKLSYWRHSFAVLALCNVSWALYMFGWFR